MLPSLHEIESPTNFTMDAVGDIASRTHGIVKEVRRAGIADYDRDVRPVHCRYCFRRHYPYGEEPKSLEQWEPAFEAIQQDQTLHEILLSGGDPLVLSDGRLGEFVERLGAIPHLKRLRVHSRLPIVLPSRVTEDLIDLLRGTRLTPFLVVHANHANELQGDCSEALRATRVRGNHCAQSGGAVEGDQR